MIFPVLRFAVAVLLALLTFALAQQPIGTEYSGANLLAAQYPFDITSRDSNVVLFVPVSKTLAQSLLPKDVKLLPSHPVPGLARDQWPLILNLGLDKDLSEYNLARVDFHHGYAGVGWVDKSKDGKTPFIRSFDALFSENYFIAVSSQLLAMFNSIPLKFTPASRPFEQQGKPAYNAVKDQHVYFDLTYKNTTDDSSKVPRKVYVDALTQGESDVFEPLDTICD